MVKKLTEVLAARGQCRGPRGSQVLFLNYNFNFLNQILYFSYEVATNCLCEIR